MRAKIITIAVSLLLLAALSGIEQMLVSRVTHDALAQTQAILTDIRAGALDEAMKKARTLDKAWDEKAKGLEILVDHGSTDDVRYALSRLIAALESEDQESSMIYAGELEGGVEHVYERQALTVENIL